MSIYVLERQRFKYVPVIFREKYGFGFFFFLEQNVAPLEEKKGKEAKGKQTEPPTSREAPVRGVQREDERN